MLFVGPAGYPPGSKGALQALENVRKLGLDALEVQFGRSVNLSVEKAREIAPRARELGIALSAHAPYYINFNSEEANRQKSEEWLLSSLRSVDAMGGRIVVVHAASYMDRPPSVATRAVVDGLNRVRQVAEDEGLSPIIGLETMGKVGSWGTIEEIGEVMAEVEGVEPVLDFAHIHARGQGCLRTEDDFRIVLDSAMDLFDGRLHCHFSCIEYTAKGEKRHLLLEKKDPDFALLCRVLPRSGRDVTIICESPDPSGDAAVMRKMLDQ
ncbi:MAG: TIM barrel protein [Methanomassiliicoccus sp.]|nr:TIM barrel protein [Methanomassiliicoccus sp.]